MPSIYLAGKIAKNDWRHAVVYDPDLDNNGGSERPGPWPVQTQGVLGLYDYTGPYFVGDDHGCWHGRNSHGIDPTGGCYGELMTRAEVSEYVYEQCQAAIRRSDVVFAWLDDPTAFGTIFELGYAAALGKPIFIGVPTKPFPAVGDMWFPMKSAEAVIIAPDAADAVRGLLDRLTGEPEPTYTFASPMEEKFWLAARAFGGVFAEMVPQHPVGRYRLDFAFPDRKLGIEIDGFDYHSSREDIVRDRARQRAIEREGWSIVRFAGSEIHRDVQTCVSEVAVRSVLA